MEAIESQIQRHNGMLIVAAYGGAGHKTRDGPMRKPSDGGTYGEGRQKLWLGLRKQRLKTVPHEKFHHPPPLSNIPQVIAGLERIFHLSSRLHQM